MLYANLLMFCSYSIASRCCSLQALSFTGFLTGYFIACHYHSLWLYGLCSLLTRSLPLPLAPSLPCRGRAACGDFVAAPTPGCPHCPHCPHRPHCPLPRELPEHHGWELDVSGPQALPKYLYLNMRWFSRRSCTGLWEFRDLSGSLSCANGKLEGTAGFHSNDS